VESVEFFPISSHSEYPNTFHRILCYPKNDKPELQKRIEELKQLGITALEFKGSKSINKIRVLGKGHVGIVVLGHTKKNINALKIRRLDADRNEMMREGEMLKLVNKNDIGPKLYGLTNNFILMEYIEGDHLPEYVINHMKKKRHIPIKRTLRKLLFDCYKMDMNNVDHGELSNASRHVIIKKNGKPVIIDFESSSDIRQTKNVQCMCNYLFMGSNISINLRKLLGIESTFPLIKALRMYKYANNRNRFENILGLSGLAY
jgi:putative serine/threonine protein kinase